MWRGILTWGVKEPRTGRADFIPTIRLLQNWKKFSHEAYNDKKKGFSLTLLAENLCWSLCHQCRATWRGSRSCFVPTCLQSLDCWPPHTVDAIITPSSQPDQNKIQDCLQLKKSLVASPHLPMVSSTNEYVLRQTHRSEAVLYLMWGKITEVSLMHHHSDILTGLIYHSLKLYYFTLSCVFPLSTAHILATIQLLKGKPFCFLKVKMTSPYTEKISRQRVTNLTYVKGVLACPLKLLIFKSLKP